MHAVKWGDSLSLQFSEFNTVKQGGVLSSLLFTLYIDNLFQQLKHYGFGCHVGNTFQEHLVMQMMLYILSPPIYWLNHLYRKCKEYSEKYDIKVLAYGSNIQGGYLNNTHIHVQCLTMENDFGNLVRSGGSDKNIKGKLSELFVHVNDIISVFVKASYKVKYQLFKIYCVPPYGSMSWDYSHISFGKLYITW